MTDQMQCLKDALHRATQDAQHWEEVCNCLVDVFGATGAILVPATPHFRGIWMSCSTRLGTTVQEYLAGGWHLRDPREQVTPLMIKNGYATDDDIFPDRAKKMEMPFYKEFLCRHNFGGLLAIRILTPNGYWGLMLHFANDHPPLSDAEQTLIEQVQPLLEQAAIQADLIAHQRIATFAQFFKGTESEVYVFDTDGEQCFNIDSTGALKTQNRLSALIPDEMSRALNNELKDICASDANLSVSRTYQFGNDGRNSSVLIIQIPPNLRHFFMPFKVCAIRTEPSDTSALKQRSLRDHYQLSDAEIATVDLLSSGNTPNMIAELMSLKASSIRQRLKVIYEKTDVSSQVELVALYSRL